MGAGKNYGTGVYKNQPRPYLPLLPAGVIIYPQVAHLMVSDPTARNRFRFILAIITLATLPCYCLGLIAVSLAPERGLVPTPTSTPTLTWTVTASPTGTLSPTTTFTASPTATPTFTPTGTTTTTQTSTSTQ